MTIDLTQSVLRTYPRCSQMLGVVCLGLFLPPILSFAAIEPDQPRIRSNRPEMNIYHYDYGDSAQHHVQKAETYRVHRMFWQAEREYLIALRFPLEEDYKANLYNNLATISTQLQHPERAQSYYRKALTLNPIDVNYYHGWLESLKAQMSDTDLEDALKDWQESDGESFIPRYALSLLYDEENRPQEALQVLEQFVIDFPYSPLTDIARLRKAQYQSSLEMLAKSSRVHIE